MSIEKVKQTGEKAMTGKEKLKLHGNDPLFRLIIDKGWPGVFSMLTILFILNTLAFSSAYLDGTLLNKKINIDAINDWGYLNQFFFLLPFLIIFTFLYFRDFEPALKRLIKTHVVSVTTADYKNYIHEVNDIYSQKWISLTSIVVSECVTFFAAETYWFAGYNNWNSPGTMTFTLTVFLSALPGVLLYYIVTGFVIRVGLLYFAVKKFMNHRVSINPLHPDKSGGLSPLGKFSVRIWWAGIVVGLSCIGGIQTNVVLYFKPWMSWPNFLILLSYIVGLSIVFFIPLLAARSGMYRAKEETLLGISRRFEKEMAMAKTEIAIDGALEKLTISLKAIKGIQEFYSIAKKMPVYPFNTQNIVRFFSSVIWPLIVFFGKHLLTKI